MFIKKGIKYHFIYFMYFTRIIASRKTLK